MLNTDDTDLKLMYQHLAQGPGYDHLIYPHPDSKDSLCILRMGYYEKLGKMIHRTYTAINSISLPPQILSILPLYIGLQYSTIIMATPLINYYSYRIDTNDKTRPHVWIRDFYYENEDFNGNISTLPHAVSNELRKYMATRQMFVDKTANILCDNMNLDNSLVEKLGNINRIVYVVELTKAEKDQGMHVINKSVNGTKNTVRVIPIQHRDRKYIGKFNTYDTTDVLYFISTVKTMYDKNVESKKMVSKLTLNEKPLESFPSSSKDNGSQLEKEPSGGCCVS